MFTGIVEEVGVVREKIPVGTALRFRFLAPKAAHRLKPGHSIACNGVCLTAEEIFPDGFTASAVPETLTRTTLGEVEKGHIVNLETALMAGSPMGGHIVQGHVDGIAEVLEMRELPAGSGKELRIRIPAAFTRYCVEKGSLTLHGISLTIAAVENDVLRFAIVPHTLSHTNLTNAGPGKRLNFEVDLVGKYVEKLLGYVSPGLANAGDAAPSKRDSGLDAGSLEKWGYGV
jgi:riboflavin synthase